MNQTLHIFKKDVRRHWPEILVSFIFLGVYLRVTMQGPRSPFFANTFSWFWLTGESVPPLMILFWSFLTVRLVQGEPLVGDRQWWVTKPYEWWELLAAKELFLLAFIAMPLFAVQLFLLHHAGFPILPNLLHVLGMQLSIGLVLFLPSVALGSLTRNLWQAVLAVILIFVGFAVVVNLLERIPNHSMSSAVGDSGDLAGTLIFASILGAVGWQYSRRKTWAARFLLLAGAVLAIALDALAPYAEYVERKYPLVEESEAPARFAAAKVNPPTKRRQSQPSFLSDVYLSIPVSVSGIALGHVVQLDGMRAYVVIPGSPNWNPGWKTQWTQFWTEDQRADLAYSVKRKDFERIKTQPVLLQVELALTEFQEKGGRDLTLKEGKFSDERLGICQLDERNPSVIQCLRPFQTPGLMASFDPSTANCALSEDEEQLPDDRVSHAWFAPHKSDDSSSSGLNPVVNYSILFGSRFWLWSMGGGVPRRPRTARLCPGAKVRLAQPEEKKHVRVKLEMDGIRLQDLNRQFAWD